jgi:hypothetical protein
VNKKAILIVLATMGIGVMAVACCVSAIILRVYGFLPRAEKITDVELSPTFQRQGIRIAKWERKVGSGGAQKWVDVFVTSANNYSPYFPEEWKGVRPDAELEITLYDRDGVVLERIWNERFPTMRAGETRTMILSSENMPRVARIAIRPAKE